MTTLPTGIVRGILCSLVVAIAPLGNHFAPPIHRLFPAHAGQVNQEYSDFGDFPRGSRPGGTRGGCPASPAAFQVLLFQQQEGQVISGQPPFFWYMSASTTIPARFMLVDLQDSRTVVEQLIEAPKAGFLRTTLPENVELLPGRKYLWSITLVCNSTRPSQNLVAQGQIQRVPVPSDLARQLATATSDRQRAQIYAKQGFWYDALAAIAAAQDANPQDPSIQEEKLALLERMGQTWVANRERR